MDPAYAELHLKLITEQGDDVASPRQCGWVAGPVPLALPINVDEQFGDRWGLHCVVASLLWGVIADRAVEHHGFEGCRGPVLLKAADVEALGAPEERRSPSAIWASVVSATIVMCL